MEGCKEDGDVVRVVTLDGDLCSSMLTGLKWGAQQHLPRPEWSLQWTSYEKMNVLALWEERKGWIFEMLCRKKW